MIKLKCKTCKDTDSFHGWKQKPYCSPYCQGSIKFTKEEVGGVLIINGITQAAKNAQRGHEDDIQQPLKKDGTINPHFVKVHGTKSIEKELKISKKQIHESVEKYG